VAAFARRAGYEIEAEFYDAAVSGADPVDANRFARDLIVQETGHKMLRNLGIELIAADSPDSFVDDTPTAVMVRQILGAVAQFEKAALVAKLKGARDRVRRTRGKCEGRKSHSEINPEAVVIAKRLHRASPKTGERMSLRRINAEIKAAGYLNERGREFNPNSIKSMVSGPQPRS
jgi:DNA invertase Pin-like site-specific DNA recombinase